MVVKTKEIPILERGKLTHPRQIEKLRGYMEKERDLIFAMPDIVECPASCSISYFLIDVFKSRKKERITPTTAKELSSMLETIEVLMDKQLIADIKEGLENLKKGGTTDLKASLREYGIE